MSIHALLFQEQENGLYKGVYLHYDGEINHVGQILIHAYPTHHAFQPIIERACPLASLGLTNQMIPHNSKDARMMTLIKKDGIEWHKYTTLLSLEREYYLATSLNNLKEGQYYQFDHDGHMEGYTLPTGEFLPYVVNQACQIVYVQARNGRWYVGDVDPNGQIEKWVRICKK